MRMEDAGEWRLAGAMATLMALMAPPPPGSPTIPASCRCLPPPPPADGAADHGEELAQALADRLARRRPCSPAAAATSAPRAPRQIGEYGRPFILLPGASAFPRSSWSTTYTTGATLFVMTTLSASPEPPPSAASPSPGVVTP
ncbi:MAG: hypothetical protein ACLSVD_10005 [Eggerthellaceae bacterium]